MNPLEDTKPKSPFKTPPRGQRPVMIEPPTDDFEPPRRGPGCVVWGLAAAVVVGLALAIVLLAGAAGWTSGQRIAQDNATATQNAEITDQLARIPGDIASGNTVLLSARVRFLATLTPGVPGMPELIQTATALSVNSQPTPAPTLAATATVPPATLTLESQQVVITQSTEGQFDLNALLEEARSQVALGQYSEAVDLLDAIVAVDSDFQRTEVRGLMLEALSTQALQLFRTGTSLAEAIVLTDRAKEFGLSGDSELYFEQYVAALYLNAKSAIGTDYATAVRALQEAYNYAPNYLDVRQLLFQQYVGFADAWAAQGDQCQAALQYQNALNILSSADVAARRDNANTLCALGTPVPGLTGDGQPIAPIGVAATPPG